MLLGSSIPHLPFPLDNLREVILVHCHFIESDLRDLLQHCRYLRKFVCTGGATSRQLIQALEPAHSSLEVLGIDLRRWAGPRSLRIPSLRRFISLKVLYIDFICFWDYQAGDRKDSPPSPDMLFTTLLPESVEEVALFGMGRNALAFGFEVEDHVQRLALDRQERRGFSRLRKLHGQAFWPFGYDVDPKSEDYDDSLLRTTTMDDAKTVLENDGVEVIFEGEGDSGLEFGNIISFW